MSRSPPASALPIDDVLPELEARLSEGRNVVLQAPPGAGKTSRAPLSLWRAAWRGDRRIVMLEPRRVAARAAATRLAESLGEPLGQTVGYRMREERRVSAKTRIEVVTEGVLTRWIQDDPSLETVAAVIFDEVHERSIHADLGLALCLEAQTALRPDLRLLAMSATLDGAALASLMNAVVVTSSGRAHPVEIRWAERPRSAEAPFEPAMATLIEAVIADVPGDALVFLPGAREIGAVHGLLAAQAPETVEIRPLYGAMSLAEQQRVLSPSADGRRRVVLATAIAETSLTIDGVAAVVDGGRARRARFDPSSGMTRLVTSPVSRAAAEQRAGRAGRTGPGWCFRLWSKAEHGALPERDPPEILETDLAPFALELAVWGARPESLPLLDRPPVDAFEAARGLLRALGALDRAGRLTRYGGVLAAAPLHPRLAHMVLRSGGENAFRLAALLEDRDPMSGADASIERRMRALDRPQAHPAAQASLRRVADRARNVAKRFDRRAASPEMLAWSLGGMVALAYPDRVAQRRLAAGPEKAARFLLANGKGARVDAGDPLASERFVAVASIDGEGPNPRVRLGAPIDLEEIEALFGDRMEWRETCAWSKRDNRVVAHRRRMLGAIALDEEPWRAAPPEAIAAAMVDGVAGLGLDALPWTAAARRLQARVEWARKTAPDLPSLSDEALSADLSNWLGPRLVGCACKADLARLDLRVVLMERLSWSDREQVNALAPESFRAPTGSAAPIDYSGDRPRAAVRIQEVFGVTRHPIVAGAPLLIDLLSPAQRPIQSTDDLPGFWRGSYVDVAKEMRARYPKHSWPADPASAPPTKSAKPRR